MRIIIDDEFDDELEKKYKAIDNELVVGNGVLYNQNVPIIEVDEINIKNNKDSLENNIINKSKEEINNYNFKNGFSIEIQGATLMDSDKDIYESTNKNIASEEANNINQERDYENINFNKNKSIAINGLTIDNEVKKNYKTKDSNENIKLKDKEKKESMDLKKLKGKITVYVKLDDIKGESISDAKVNLYALNGLSPKLISSKITDKSGIVIFDNLEVGSYRIIEIINRKYFEKPTYIQWNEVTINKNLYVEEVIIINKIKRY